MPRALLGKGSQTLDDLIEIRRAVKVGSHDVLRAARDVAVGVNQTGHKAGAVEVNLLGILCLSASLLERAGKRDGAVVCNQQGPKSLVLAGHGEQSRR